MCERVVFFVFLSSSYNIDLGSPPGHPSLRIVTVRDLASTDYGGESVNLKRRQPSKYFRLDFVEWKRCVKPLQQKKTL